MPTYFLDTSAIIKRYLHEDGTRWIRHGVFSAENHLIIARITQVEVASALARRVRGKTLAPKDETALLRLFRQHLRLRLSIIEVDAQRCNEAMLLAHEHGLRGYDSVQLACGLYSLGLFRKSELGAAIFLTADAKLLAAASAEGLLTDNPEDHE